MKKLGIAFLLLFILSVVAQPQIEVKTDKIDYSNGEIIAIEGKVTEKGKPYADKFVSLEIRDSQDEVKYVSTKTTNSEGEFMDSLVLPKSNTKSVYSLTISVENARQTITFKYGAVTGSQNNTDWLYGALGGLAFIIFILVSMIIFLIIKQKRKEVRHMTREQRIEQLTDQIEEIEGKYGITERSMRLHHKLEDMKKG